MFLIRDTWQCHTNCRKPNPREFSALLFFHVLNTQWIWNNNQTFLSLLHLSLCYKRVTCHLKEKQTKGCFFFNDKGHSRLADFENRKMRKNTKINKSNFFFPLFFLYNSPKFSNSSQQLISHTNIPLLHTYFPESKSAAAMKSFQIFVNVRE